MDANRIYYDCEFLDDGRTIAPISIGMVDNLGHSLYRIIRDDVTIGRAFNSPWLRANVLPHLPVRQLSDTWAWDTGNSHMHYVRDRAQVAQDIKHFVASQPGTELWSWYGAYDHVMVAQLLGPMADLPEGFPMFTCDLEQEIRRLGLADKHSLLPGQNPREAHSALADARWHRRIGNFLLKYEHGDPVEL